MRPVAADRGHNRAGCHPAPKGVGSIAARRRGRQRSPDRRPSGPERGRLHCGMTLQRRTMSRGRAIRPRKGSAPLRPTPFWRGDPLPDGPSGPERGRLHCGATSGTALAGAVVPSGPERGRLHCGTPCFAFRFQRLLGHPAPKGVGSIAASLSASRALSGLGTIRPRKGSAPLRPVREDQRTNFEGLHPAPKGVGSIAAWRPSP